MDFGVGEGLTPEDAKLWTAGTFFGLLSIVNDENLEELISQLPSPNGPTERGLKMRVGDRASKTVKAPLQATTGRRRALGSIK